MSYESMAKEDFGCSFPTCSHVFWRKLGVNNAILKDGEILAFCKAHCAQLANSGVTLRPLRDIHREFDLADRRQHDLAKDDREKAFIESLKRG